MLQCRFNLMQLIASWLYVVHSWFSCGSVVSGGGSVVVHLGGSVVVQIGGIVVWLRCIWWWHDVVWFSIG